MHRVVLTATVHDAIDAQVACLRAAELSDAVVSDWLVGLFDRILVLGDMPRTGAVAEVVSRVKGYEVHRLNHGEYAVFYRVFDEPAVVEVSAFRHGRRQPWLHAGPREASPGA
jgi:plasmid stabilization system protein ParE